MYRSAETRLNVQNLVLKQAATELNDNRIFTVRRIIYFTRVYEIHHPMGRAALALAVRSLRVLNS